MTTMRLSTAASRCLLFCLAACSSVDDPHAGRRVGHPPQPPPSAISSAAQQQDAGPPPPATFTPLDYTIADACDGSPKFPGGPAIWPYAWSKNVPTHDCTHDVECGDGFCDRGRCAAIWTCYERYGQRCISGLPAPSPHIGNSRCKGLCLEGRCQSCLSDEECMKELGTPKAICGLLSTHAGVRGCYRMGEAPDSNRELPAP